MVVEKIEKDLFSYLTKQYYQEQIYLQVALQESALVIVVNHTDDCILNYSYLTKLCTKICIDQIRLSALQSISNLVIYSRLWGESDIEWQTEVNLVKYLTKPSVVPSAFSLVAVTNTNQSDNTQVSARSHLEKSYTASSEVSNLHSSNSSESTSENKSGNILESTSVENIESTEPIKTELHEYCFARNVLLVKADLPIPNLSVAKAVIFFHELSADERLQIAPILVNFFKDPKKTSFTQLSSQWQSWLTDIQTLSDRDFKSVSVWLSRYCINPEKTLEQVNITLGTISATPSSEVSEHPKTQEKPINSPNVNPHSTKLSQSRTSVKSSNKSELNVNIAVIIVLMVRHWYLTLTLMGMIFGFSGNIWGLVFPASTRGSGQILADHLASGTITKRGKILYLKGAGAIWNPSHKELRISILPVSVTSGDIEKLQKLIKEQGQERSSNDFPARSLVASRPSHDPQQFADMPASQLDIKFDDDATEFATDQVKAYNLVTAWPLSPRITSFEGFMCYFLPCQDPKEGLTIESFEPKAGGVLKLSVNPQTNQGEMQVAIQVQTKVNIQEP